MGNFPASDFVMALDQMLEGGQADRWNSYCKFEGMLVQMQDGRTHAKMSFVNQEAPGQQLCGLSIKNVCSQTRFASCFSLVILYEMNQSLFSPVAIS